VLPRSSSARPCLRPGSPSHGAGQVPAQDGLRQQPVPPRQALPKLKADGYAHHPYDFEHAPKRSIRGKDDATIGSLRHLTRALDELAHSGQLKGTKKLYLTEYGYLATGRRGLSERKRASYLKQGLRIARKNRRVKEVVQYLLVQPNNGSPFTTGIISASGVATPSFAVLRAAA
jgi:hypothetical protein